MYALQLVIFASVLLSASALTKAMPVELREEIAKREHDMLKMKRDLMDEPHRERTPEERLAHEAARAERRKTDGTSLKRD
jgi:hypothetical protein